MAATRAITAGESYRFAAWDAVDIDIGKTANDQSGNGAAVYQKPRVMGEKFHYCRQFQLGH